MIGDNILYGGDYEFTVPNKSYTELIFREIIKGGHKTALIDAESGATLTFTEVINKSLQLAAQLKSMGLKKGDVVAICSENCIEYVLPILACLYLGVIVAPLNFAYTKHELHHTINISQPCLVFCSTKVEATIAEVQRENKFIKRIIVLGNFSRTSEALALGNLLDGRSTHYEMDIEKVDFLEMNVKEDVAFIFCSSGTTGLPKGVLTTHRNLVVFHHLLSDQRLGMILDDDVLVSFLPMFHAYGFMTTLNSLSIHSQTVIVARFEFETYLQLIEKYRATICLLVPPICVMLTKSPLVERYDLSSIRLMFCGAAPLSKEVTLAVKKRLNIKEIRQGYGMTETTLGSCIQPVDDIRYGGVGRLIPGFHAKVLDLQTGQTVGPFRIGELCVKGDLIMKGYCRNPKETAATIDIDGWMHTGDVVYYDDSEYFFIVDRLKELIKYNGFQVPPAELEALLLNHPAVKDVGVIGIPDEIVGERAVAFVVRQPNVQVNADDIIKYVEDRVSPQKNLHGGVQFIAEIPKNPSGKVLRREFTNLQRICNDYLGVFLNKVRGYTWNSKYRYNSINLIDT